MPRYIDADLIDFSCLLDTICQAQAEEVIDEQPTADVAEIVRCKDCKHRPYKDDDGDVWAPSWDDEICPCICEDCFYNWMPDDDFFCGKGERKEDEID